MPLYTLQEIRFENIAGKRLLGLDVGSKTVGLSMSDSLHTIASPLKTLKRDKFKPLLEDLTKTIQEYKIGGLVIGMPINMNGTEGPRCEATKQFATNLMETIDLPVIYWDERLSTAAVTKLLIEADMSRKKRGLVVDKMAASYILQGFLDFMRQKKNG